MSLENLNDRLYATKDDLADKQGTAPMTPRPLNVPPRWTGEVPQTITPTMTPQKPRSRKIMAFFGLVVVFLLGIIGVLGYMLFTDEGAKYSDRIVMTNELPEKVASGDVMTLKVHYKNENPVALENATLIMHYPAGTLIEAGSRADTPVERKSLGTLAPNAEGEATFQGTVFGKPDDVLEGRVVLEYRPSDSSAVFLKENPYKVTLTHSTIAVALELPKELQSGQDATLTVRVNSSADATVDNLTVALAFPEAFTYTSASPELAEKMYWTVGSIAPGEERQLKVKGKVMGEAGAPMTFRADIGIREPYGKLTRVFASGEAATTVQSALLAVETVLPDTPENIARAGQEFSVVMYYRNNLPVSVKDAVIKTEILGDAIDVASIASPDGTYDGQSRTITWLPGNVTALSVLDPGEEGRVRFRIKVKNPLPVKTSSDKNFTITLRSTITSPTVPEGYSGVRVDGSAESRIRVLTETGFSQRGYYNDNRFSNTGPLPPKVGEETTYTIVWAALTSANDLRDVVVTATIPTYVRWKDAILPSGRDLTFDQNTGKITWKIPVLPAGSGYASRPSVEVAFQLALVPSAAQVGTSPEIISQATLTARDAFTGSTITKTSPAQTSAMRDDPKLEQPQERVVR